MKNNIGKVLDCGRHFEFSSVNAENSLVPLPARHKRESPDDVIFMIRLLKKRHVGSFYQLNFLSERGSNGMEL